MPVPSGVQVPAHGCAPAVPHLCPGGFDVRRLEGRLRPGDRGRKTDLGSFYGILAQAASAGAPTAAPSIKIPEEDIELVMAQANASYDDARQALIEAKGEPAEAIIKLMSR